MERLIISTIGLAFGLITALVFGFEVYEAFNGETLSGVRK